MTSPLASFLVYMGLVQAPVHPPADVLFEQHEISESHGRQDDAHLGGVHFAGLGFHVSSHVNERLPIEGAHR